MRLYWEFAGDEVEQAGALPPERLQLPYVTQADVSAYRIPDYTRRWRILEAGYDAEPADCPPIRLIGTYGFLVRCPGNVTLRRRTVRASERSWTNGAASFAWCDIEGDPWPEGDSGLIASWISTSQYAKVQTGVRIWFPASVHLYQGPLPNSTLMQTHRAQVMAGLEYPRAATLREIGGKRYARADLNVIVALPECGSLLTIERGCPLAWAFPCLRRSAFDLAPIDGLERTERSD